MATGALISMSEIAELAGVRRPVVSNWRRRHPDFPAPVADGHSKRLFDAEQVVDWLARTDRGERSELTAELRLHLLTALANPPPGRRAAGSPSSVLITTTALICLRYLGDDEPLAPSGDTSWRVVASLRDRAAKVDPEDRLLRSEIEALGPEQGTLPGMVDELVEAAWGCRQAFERVLAARHRFADAELEPDAVTAPLATLMAGLSGAREHAERYGAVHVVDPAAGLGDLLIAVLDQLDEDVEVTVAANERDPVLARLLRRRLAVSGLPDAEWAVTAGPDLPDSGADPDVLVTRLPYLPKERRHQEDHLASVARHAERLAPGRTAVVLGPEDLLTGALPPYHRAFRTRKRLLDDGWVEAMVHLPGGMMPYRPGYETALWVLRQEEESPWRDRVLLADVADRPLAAVVDDLVVDVTTWRREGYLPEQHHRAYGAQVRATDLARHRVRLTTRRPPRVLDQAPERAVARAVELEVALDPATADDRPAPLRSGLEVRPTPLSVTRDTIAVLRRERALKVRPGTRLDPRHVAREGHHRVIGAAELTGERPVGSRRVDRLVLAERYPRAALTEPGDVVVTLTPRLGVYLDQEGFAVVEFPARALRILPDGAGRFTPRVLAALLAALPQAGYPTDRAAGAVRPPARLDDVQLPKLPSAEVARLEELLAAAEARKERARREIETVDELCRIATTGLVHGRLTLVGTTPPPSSR